MPSLHDAYPEIRERLDGHAPPSPVQPADLEPFAAIVLAWLDRELGGAKADLALGALRDSGLIDPKSLVEAHPSEITQAIRSAGGKLTPKSEATLRKIAAWAHGRGEDSLADAPTGALRDELLALNGIGPGTADALLLDGLDRPVYPVDRPSYRIFARHGWIDPTAEYDEARDVFERLEPENPAGLRRLSASLNAIAKQFCRATQAKCERCPLRPFLPEGGPIEGDG